MMFHRSAASVLLLPYLPTVLSQQYELIQTYTPENFFDEFRFFTDPDPTGGFVQYVPFDTAAQAGLVSNASNLIYMGVDTTNFYRPGGPGRPSVRLESKMTFTEGLFVLDLAHMPVACGSWPAFWSVGLGDWPSDGEIDIIENVNDARQNNAALHAAGDCTVSSGVQQSGIWKSTDCNAVHDGNQGCGTRFTEPANFGPEFNANGGGVYAMEWTSDRISIWFFPPDKVPTVLSNPYSYYPKTSHPDTSTFGRPSASFTGPCSSTFAEKFFNHTLVFDTTFCGGWAGTTFGEGNSQCPQYQGLSNRESCERFVGTNPRAFREAYWALRSLRVWEKVPGYTTASNAAQGMPNKASSLQPHAAENLGASPLPDGHKLHNDQSANNPSVWSTEGRTLPRPGSLPPNLKKQMYPRQLGLALNSSAPALGPSAPLPTSVPANVPSPELPVAPLPADALPPVPILPPAPILPPVGLPPAMPIPVPPVALNALGAPGAPVGVPSFPAPPLSPPSLPTAPNPPVPPAAPNVPGILLAPSLPNQAVPVPPVAPVSPPQAAPIPASQGQSGRPDISSFLNAIGSIFGQQSQPRSPISRPQPGRGRHGWAEGQHDDAGRHGGFAGRFGFRDHDNNRDRYGRPWALNRRQTVPLPAPQVRPVGPLLPAPALPPLVAPLPRPVSSPLASAAPAPASPAPVPPGLRPASLQSQFSWPSGPPPGQASIGASATLAAGAAAEPSRVSARISGGASAAASAALSRSVNGGSLPGPSSQAAPPQRPPTAAPDPFSLSAPQRPSSAPSVPGSPPKAPSALPPGVLSPPVAPSRPASILSAVSAAAAFVLSARPSIAPSVPLAPGLPSQAPRPSILPAPVIVPAIPPAPPAVSALGVPSLGPRPSVLPAPLEAPVVSQPSVAGPSPGVVSQVSRPSILPAPVAPPAIPPAFPVAPVGGVSKPVLPSQPPRPTLLPTPGGANTVPLPASAPTFGALSQAPRPSILPAPPMPPIASVPILSAPQVSKPAVPTAPAASAAPAAPSLPPVGAASVPLVSPMFAPPNLPTPQASKAFGILAAPSFNGVPPQAASPPGVSAPRVDILAAPSFRAPPPPVAQLPSAPILSAPQASRPLGIVAAPTFVATPPSVAQVPSGPAILAPQVSRPVGIPAAPGLPPAPAPPFGPASVPNLAAPQVSSPVSIPAVPGASVVPSAPAVQPLPRPAGVSSIALLASDSRWIGPQQALPLSTPPLIPVVPLAPVSPSLPAAGSQLSALKPVDGLPSIAGIPFAPSLPAVPAPAELPSGWPVAPPPVVSVLQAAKAAGIPSIPNVPAAPAIPAVPAAPAIPSGPSVPAVPGVPPVPGAPAIASIPAVPGPVLSALQAVKPGSIPSAPGIPLAPNLPVASGILSLSPRPSLPSAPGVPSLPPAPGLPVAPAIPSAPGVPAVPSLPAAPNAPSIPAAPNVPAEPSLPRVPNAPAAPSLPAAPVSPASPSILAVPAVPSAPIAPGAPAIPSLPGAPAAPSVPGVPNATTVPSLPAVPGAPDAPSLPEAPGILPLRPAPNLPAASAIPPVPVVPAAPNLPSVPAVPAIPAIPGVPVAPSLPVAPSAPAAPGVIAIPFSFAPPIPHHWPAPGPKLYSLPQVATAAPLPFAPSAIPIPIAPQPGTASAGSTPSATLGSTPPRTLGTSSRTPSLGIPQQSANGTYSTPPRPVTSSAVPPEPVPPNALPPVALPRPRPPQPEVPNVAPPVGPSIPTLPAVNPPIPPLAPTLPTVPNVTPPAIPPVPSLPAPPAVPNIAPPAVPPVQSLPAAPGAQRVPPLLGAEVPSNGPPVVPSPVVPSVVSLPGAPALPAVPNVAPPDIAPVVPSLPAVNPPAIPAPPSVPKVAPPVIASSGPSSPVINPSAVPVPPTVPKVAPPAIAPSVPSLPALNRPDAPVLPSVPSVGPSIPSLPVINPVDVPAALVLPAVPSVVPVISPQIPGAPVVPAQPAVPAVAALAQSLVPVAPEVPPGPVGSTTPESLAKFPNSWFSPSVVFPNLFNLPSKDTFSKVDPDTQKDVQNKLSVLASFNPYTWSIPSYFFDTNARANVNANANAGASTNTRWRARREAAPQAQALKSEASSAAQPMLLNIPPAILLPGPSPVMAPPPIPILPSGLAPQTMPSIPPAVPSAKVPVNTTVKAPSSTLVNAPAAPVQSQGPAAKPIPYSWISPAVNFPSKMNLPGPQVAQLYPPSSLQTLIDILIEAAKAGGVPNAGSPGVGGATAPNGNSGIVPPKKGPIRREEAAAASQPVAPGQGATPGTTPEISNALASLVGVNPLLAAALLANPLTAGALTNPLGAASLTQILTNALPSVKGSQKLQDVPIVAPRGLNSRDHDDLDEEVDSSDDSYSVPEVESGNDSTDDLEEDLSGYDPTDDLGEVPTAYTTDDSDIDSDYYGDSYTFYDGEDNGDGYENIRRRSPEPQLGLPLLQTGSVAGLPDLSTVLSNLQGTLQGLDAANPLSPNKIIAALAPTLNTIDPSQTLSNLLATLINPAKLLDTSNPLSPLSPSNPLKILDSLNPLSPSKLLNNLNLQPVNQLLQGLTPVTAYVRRSPEPQLGATDTVGALQNIFKGLESGNSGVSQAITLLGRIDPTGLLAGLATTLMDPMQLLNPSNPLSPMNPTNPINIMDSLNPLSPLKILNAVKAATPLTSVTNPVAQALQPVTQDLQGIAAQLGPAVAQVVGQVGQAVGPVAAQVGPAIAPITGPLGQALAPATGPLNDALALVRGSLIQLLQGGAPGRAFVRRQAIADDTLVVPAPEVSALPSPEVTVETPVPEIPIEEPVPEVPVPEVPLPEILSPEAPIQAPVPEISVSEVSAPALPTDISPPIVPIGPDDVIYIDPLLPTQGPDEPLPEGNSFETQDESGIEQLNQLLQAGQVAAAGQGEADAAGNIFQRSPQLLQVDESLLTGPQLTTPQLTAPQVVEPELASPQLVEPQVLELQPAGPLVSDTPLPDVQLPEPQIAQPYLNALSDTTDLLNPQNILFTSISQLINSLLTNFQQMTGDIISALLQFISAPSVDNLRNLLKAPGLATPGSPVDAQASQLLQAVDILGSGPNAIPGVPVIPTPLRFAHRLEKASHETNVDTIFAKLDAGTVQQLDAVLWDAVPRISQTNTAGGYRKRSAQLGSILSSLLAPADSAVSAGAYALGPLGLVSTDQISSLVNTQISTADSLPSSILGVSDSSHVDSQGQPVPQVETIISTAGSPSSDAVNPQAQAGPDILMSLIPSGPYEVPKSSISTVETATEPVTTEDILQALGGISSLIGSDATSQVLQEAAPTMLGANTASAMGRRQTPKTLADLLSALDQPSKEKLLQVVHQSANAILAHTPFSSALDTWNTFTDSAKQQILDWVTSTNGQALPSSRMVQIYASHLSEADDLEAMGAMDDAIKGTFNKLIENSRPEIIDLLAPATATSKDQLLGRQLDYIPNIKQIYPEDSSSGIPVDLSDVATSIMYTGDDLSQGTQYSPEVDPEDIVSESQILSPSTGANELPNTLGPIDSDSLSDYNIPIEDLVPTEFTYPDKVSDLPDITNLLDSTGSVDATGAVDAGGEIESAIMTRAQLRRDYKHMLKTRQSDSDGVSGGNGTNSTTQNTFWLSFLNSLLDAITTDGPSPTSDDQPPTSDACSWDPDSPLPPCQAQRPFEVVCYRLIDQFNSRPEGTPAASSPAFGAAKNCLSLMGNFYEMIHGSSPKDSSKAGLSKRKILRKVHHGDPGCSDRRKLDRISMDADLPIMRENEDVLLAQPEAALPALISDADTPENATNRLPDTGAASEYPEEFEDWSPEESNDWEEPSYYSDPGYTPSDHYSTKGYSHDSYSGDSYSSASDYPSDPEDRIHDFMNKFQIIGTSIPSMKLGSLVDLLSIFYDPSIPPPQKQELVDYTDNLKDFIIQFFFFEQALRNLPSSEREQILADMRDNNLVRRQNPTPGNRFNEDGVKQIVDQYNKLGVGLTSLKPGPLESLLRPTNVDGKLGISKPNADSSYEDQVKYFLVRYIVFSKFLTALDENEKVQLAKALADVGPPHIEILPELHSPAPQVPGVQNFTPGTILGAGSSSTPPATGGTGGGSTSPAAGGSAGALSAGSGAGSTAPTTDGTLAGDNTPLGSSGTTPADTTSANVAPAAAGADTSDANGSTSNAGTTPGGASDTTAPAGGSSDSNPPAGIAPAETVGDATLPPASSSDPSDTSDSPSEAGGTTPPDTSSSDTTPEAAGTSDANDASNVAPGADGTTSNASDTTTPDTTPANGDSSEAPATEGTTGQPTTPGATTGGATARTRKRYMNPHGPRGEISPELASYYYGTLGADERENLHNFVSEATDCALSDSDSKDCLGSVESAYNGALAPTSSSSDSAPLATQGNSQALANEAINQAGSSRPNTRFSGPSSDNNTQIAEKPQGPAPAVAQELKPTIPEDVKASNGEPLNNYINLVSDDWVNRLRDFGVAATMYNQASSSEESPEQYVDQVSDMLKNSWTNLDSDARKDIMTMLTPCEDSGFDQCDANNQGSSKKTSEGAPEAQEEPAPQSRWKYLSRFRVRAQEPDEEQPPVPEKTGGPTPQIDLDKILGSKGTLDPMGMLDPEYKPEPEAPRPQVSSPATNQRPSNSNSRSRGPGPAQGTNPYWDDASLVDPISGEFIGDYDDINPEGTNLRIPGSLLAGAAGADMGAGAGSLPQSAPKTAGPSGSSLSKPSSSSSESQLKSEYHNTRPRPRPGGSSSPSPSKASGRASAQADSESTMEDWYGDATGGSSNKFLNSIKLTPAQMNEVQAGDGVDTM